ncbi:uncharacterized protein LOC110459905 isoform X2 [Mizuhopecten yessoensis]|nr:uncharacterized protein LOC110459905 isoform X2 [Mizuhopecten yessoensis]XP_021368072.1 uncharacterized protein LOC110459905 isoform X2 [Mizuhopecten yessoensis]
MAGQVVKDVNIDVSSEKCTDHDKTVEFSCQTCNGEMVCRKCVLQGHNGHFMGDVQKFISKQRQAVLKVLYETDERLEQLDADMANVEERISMNNAESELLISQIEERGRVLKVHIDEIVANGKKQARRYRNRNDRILKKVLAKITHSNMEFEEKSQKCRTLVNSTKYKDIKKALKVGEQLKEDLSAEDETTSTRNRTFIVPSPSEDIATLETLFGKLKIDASKIATVSLTLKSSFCNVDDEAVFRICPVMEGEAAWVGGDECKVSLFTFEGVKLDTIELDSGVNDLCVLPQNNDLVALVVACEDNTIRKLIPDGADSVEDELFRFESDPQSISFTADNEIIIVSSGQVKPIKVDTSGDRKSLGSGNVMDWQLTSPNTVRVNGDSGDVVILNNDPGCLYVCDEKLNLKFTYRGQQMDDPQGVTFDRDGNILIADCGSCSVLLLDSKGHFLQTLITSQDHPQAVEILQDSATHVLWVGYSSGKVETYTYSFK